MVKSMWRRAFCILSLSFFAAPLDAQPIPGRDLLEFPIVAIAEAPALATLSRTGLWNPATILFSPEQRARIVAAALDGSSEQGITAQLVAFAVPLGPSTAIGFTGLRATVSGLVRTEGDPQSVGPDIPYGTLLLSTNLAHRIGRILDAGIAVRIQRGEMDTDVRTGGMVDVGFLLHSITSRDIRVAASTFLMRSGFGSGSGADTRLSAATDLRLLGASSERQLRGGYSYARTPSLSSEHYLFASGRLEMLELNAGVLRTLSHGSRTDRSRFGIGLRSETVFVGLAREENTAGIAPTYQVAISSYFRR